MKKEIGTIVTESIPIIRVIDIGRKDGVFKLKVKDREYLIKIKNNGSYAIETFFGNIKFCFNDDKIIWKLNMFSLAYSKGFRVKNSIEF